MSVLDWKAMFLDPAYDRNGRLHQIPQKITKKGVITDPGGMWKVAVIADTREAKGDYDPVELSEPFEHATNFLADAEPEGIVDPMGLATTVIIPGSTYKPVKPRTVPFTHLTFRTVSTPRFNDKGRPIGSKPDSWIHNT
jgi:hypothetical protein